MKKIYFFLTVLLIILATNLHASKDDWNRKLYDSVRFAEDGKSSVVDFEQIKLSLVKGANPNWIKSEGKDISVLSNYVTVLSLSDYQDKNTPKEGLKAIKMLFEYGAKLQYCDGGILFFPIASGKYDIVKLLLEKGASATFLPKHEIGASITPIEVATKKGDTQIIALLVRYGAIRLSEKEAVQLQFIYEANFGSIDDLKSLFDRGARVDEANNQGETALLNSVSGFDDHSKYYKVMFLLDKGADVNQRGKGSFCITFPLHDAIFYSSFAFNSKIEKYTSYAEEILRQLIKKGAYVASEDERGRTPLHIAAETNHLFAAQLLLDSGSKVMPKDKTGKTPLAYAKSSEMIKLLKKYGAKEQ
jgi:ankyrin repeat protein